MVLLVEDSGEGVAAPCRHIALRLRYPLIQAHLLRMLCFNVDTGQANHVRRIASIAAILCRPSGIIAVFPET